MTEAQRVYEYQRRVKGLPPLHRVEMAAHLVNSTCVTPQVMSTNEALELEVADLADKAIESWKGRDMDFQLTVAAEVLFRLHHSLRLQLNAARLVESAKDE